MSTSSSALMVLFPTHGRKCVFALSSWSTNPCCFKSYRDLTYTTLLDLEQMYRIQCLNPQNNACSDHLKIVDDVSLGSSELSGTY